MLRRFHPLINVVCLLIAAISSLAAMPCKALAEPPATVPTRVVRELDGQYTIETRPTSDGLHAGITADIPQNVPVYSRQPSGETIPGAIIICDGTNDCQWPSDVRLSRGTGWQIGSAALLSTVFGTKAHAAPWTLTRLDVTTIQYLAETDPNELLRRRAESQHTSTIGPPGVRIVLPAGSSPDTVAVARRVETVYNNILSEQTPLHVQVSSAVFPQNVLADTTVPIVSQPYPLVTLFGLYFNSINTGENQEELLYERFPTGNTYNFKSTPGGPVVTATNLLVAYHLNNVVLGLNFPQGPLPTIAINSAVANRFDFARSNGIATQKDDYEAMLTHEMLHALGIISAGSQISNAVVLPDIFRVGPGESSVSFSSATRRVGTFAPSVFVPLSGIEIPMHVEPLGFHWQDDTIGPFFGALDPTLASGTFQDFILYQNDLRALDIIGYNFNPIPAGTPPALLPEFPVQDAAPSTMLHTRSPRRSRQARSIGGPSHRSAGPVL